MRLAPPIYRSISDFRLAVPAPRGTFYHPGLPAHSGLSDSGCSELAPLPPASCATRRSRCPEQPCSASLSAGFRRWTDLCSAAYSAVTYATVLSAATYLPASHSRHLLPVAPLAGAVSNSSFVPVSGNEDRSYLLRQDGACNSALSLRRMHRRPDAFQLVSARYHAVVSASHCCHLTPQTDSLQTWPLYLVFSPESRIAPQPRRHCLDRFTAQLLCGLIRLSLALTGLRFRFQQPEISHRFRGCQFPALFRFGTLGRPRVGSGLAAPPYPTGCGSQAMFL